MKNPAIFIVLLLLVNSCTNNHPKAGESAKSPEQQQDVQKQKKPDIPNPFTLVALEVVDSTNQNAFQKYGMAFSGNCYSCDIAHLQISGREITFVNACDAQQSLTFSIETFVQNDQQIYLETREAKFVFSKIANAPVYQLKVSGKPLKDPNLLLGKFYTFQEKLPKFEIHDCGDFQG